MLERFTAASKNIVKRQSITPAAIFGDRRNPNLGWVELVETHQVIAHVG